jgi:neutral ceramidase
MSLGFVGQALDAIVDGVVESIVLAHNDLRLGSLSYGSSILKDASINRSPSAYLNNPAEERSG